MFIVAWLKVALDELAELYVALDPPRRQRLSDAVHQLNLRLAQRPLEEGESRDSPFRITFLDGVSIYFSVDLPNGRVRVTGVRRRRS